MAVKVDRAAKRPGLRRFTVDEYLWMSRAYILDPEERTELVDGQVFRMPSVGPTHAWLVDKLARTFFEESSGRAHVRVQGPVEPSRRDQLLPDIALLRLRQDRYRSFNPASEDILLLIEVCDTSLDYDRRKLRRYAVNGVPEVWLWIVGGPAVEVHQQPTGDRYQSIQRFGLGQVLEPTLLSGLQINIDEIWR